MYLWTWRSWRCALVRGMFLSEAHCLSTSEASRDLGWCFYQVPSLIHNKLSNYLLLRNPGLSQPSEVPHEYYKQTAQIWSDSGWTAEALPGVAPGFEVGSWGLCARGFLLVLWFPCTSQKHGCRWFCVSKSSPLIRVSVKMCIRSSWDKIWSCCNTDQDKEER